MTQIPTKFPLPVGHCLGITLCALSLLLRRLIRRYCQFPREREREREAGPEEQETHSVNGQEVCSSEKRRRARHPGTIMFFT